MKDAKELAGDERDSANPTADFAPRIAKVQAGLDKNIMDPVLVILRRRGDVERELLKNREADARWSGWLTMITTGVGTLAAIVLVSVGGSFLVRSITRPVRAAVDQLASASAEILASTTQQAAGAQEQAAAVTQTMATVDEVTQTADQAAQRAKSVGDTVQRTLDIGKTGRKVVEESLVAMDAVKEKVETTAENILTLAGEHDDRRNHRHGQ